MSEVLERKKQWSMTCLRYLNDGEIYDYIFREFYNTRTFVHCLCTQLFLE
jgi:hypothetical protein